MKDFFINKGFSKEEVEGICQYAESKKLNKAHLISSYDIFYNTLMSMGYDEIFIHELVCAVPLLIYKPIEVCNNIKNLKAKKLYQDKIKDYADALLIDINDFNKKYDFLKSIGFTIKEISDMYYNNNKLFCYSEKNIIKHIEVFKKLGLSNNDIRKVFIYYSYSILYTSATELNNRFEELKKLGFTKEDIKTIISYYPNNIFNKYRELIKLCSFLISYKVKIEDIMKEITRSGWLLKYNPNNFNNVKNYLIKNGFTKDEVAKLVRKFPSIVIISLSHITKFYNWFYNKEFLSEEIKSVLASNPKLVLHNDKKFDLIYNVLTEYFEKDVVKKIILGYPRIFESSYENLEEKFKLYQKLGISDYVTINPKNMMQGAKKTCLRFDYLFNEMDIEIDENNYRKLFETHFIADDNKIDSSYVYEKYTDDESLEKRLEKRKKEGKKIICKQ